MTDEQTPHMAAVNTRVAMNDQIPVDLPEDWDAEQEEREADAGRVIFDLLRRAGYDRAVVDYDAIHGSLDILRITFFRDGAEVADPALVKEVWPEVKGYLYETLQDGWDEAGCYGQVRLYPGSGYAFFLNTERVEESACFTRGVPGPEVPDDDRW